VQLPCLHRYSPPPPSRVPVTPWRWQSDCGPRRSDHALLKGWWCDHWPERSDRASTTTGPQDCWRFDSGLGQLDRLRNRGWWSTATLGGQTARPFIASSWPASPMTSVVPNAASMAPPVPCVTPMSTTPPVPPVALAS
jgi:hypothetical protein